jgi:glycosyltransferase involved in cell wall biosynthesis
VIFVGRLAAEKGVNILIDAWRLWSGAPVLEIIGDGPERESLENVVITSGLQSKVRFLGRRPFAETQERLSTARLIVVPSLWYEGFPLVIREALACGVPVVASRLGSLEHIVSEDDVGRLFVPSSASDLYHVLRELWNNQTILAAYAEAARQTYLAKYTPERGYTQLMSIYQRAISEKRKGQGRESPQL